MKPTALHARNFRTYPVLDVEFQDGLVGIIGELRNQADGASSNGAGKSSILEAVDIALFGRRSLAPYLRRGVVGEELLIELELEHGGELYRIRRSFKAKKTPTLDFETWKDGPLHSGDDTGPMWEPLTLASAKETQQLIEQTIGLSRDTYRNSSYLRQGEGSFADPAIDPRARRNLLTAAVFGADSVYPARQQQAHAERVRLQEQHLEATGRIKLAQELVDAKPAIVAQRDQAVEAETDLADTIADLERDHAALAERYQAAREQGARRTAAEAELREAITTVEQLTKQTTAAEEAARAVAAAVAELEKLPADADTASLETREAQLAAAVEAHARLVAERELVTATIAQKTMERVSLGNRAGDAQRLADELRAKVEQLRADDEHAKSCDRCGQQLAGEARAYAIGNMLEEAAAHAREAVSLRVQADAIVSPVLPPEPEAPPVGELEQVRGQLRTIRESSAQRAQLEERIRQNEAVAASCPAPDDMRAALAAVTAKTATLEQLAPVDLEAITTLGSIAKARLDATRATLGQQRDLRARLDERLAQIAAAESSLAEAAEERKTLDGSLAVAAELERIYGPAGIPTLVLENIAIPQIETEANRLLAALGCPYTVELRTQADKADGGVKETFDVIVVDEQGEEAPFEECTSGGEKTRIGLALRIALARLLSHRRGAESRILCLDEPSYLDEAGMRALLAVLAELQSDFDTVLLVSHVAELRDSFDNTLLVVRDGATSRIDSGDREPVAA